MIPKQITADLRNGLSLEETLVKHQTNLKTLFHDNILKQPLTKQRSREVTYILEANNHFTIRKNIEGKTKVFGVYNSREDAETIRDELICNGWNQKSVERLCKEHGIERCYGKFESRYKVA